MFDRLGAPETSPRRDPAKRPTLADRPKRLILLVPVKGIEPSTFALQVRKRQHLSALNRMQQKQQVTVKIGLLYLQTLI
ncbi:hypothetical protein [Zoogloea sp.]|uniref:hypothetical protein n=1 Tax=Zoogloea sp. TaxID=49181 RepID=UPI0035AEDA8D